MFDFLPTKIIPPALLGSMLLYGLICMLWLQPLVESRMAELTYVPQCEANLKNAEASTPLPDNPRQRELELLIRMYEQSGLERLPYVREIIQIARTEMEQLKPKRFRSSHIQINGICACAVENIFAENHLKMALSVASLRTHIPAFLKSMDRNLLSVAASGTCGAFGSLKG
uniref:hypothetical protein n=1 Tax=Pararhizobium sp. IMCC3301 TaxID=3067904 RepID=UPI002741C0CC|nr:hypothetical protein [Pararhizobium sp. IMCC3301]